MFVSTVLRRMRLVVGSAASAAVLAGSVGCVPDPPPAPQPTRLEIHTNLYYCQGIVINGVRACFTNPRSSTVLVSRRGSTVASGISDAQGRLVLDVPAGGLTVSVVEPHPEYETCPAVGVTAIAEQTVVVTHQCSFMAP